jgi:uracil-DNA glycosylase
MLSAYHPSLQNTNTGKLTEKMLLDVFKRAGKLVGKR